jgi:alkylation response protein AidB-like acyl-CoA dehydrogenase
VDFAFSSEQEMLRDSARDLLAKRCGPERVAETAVSDRGWDPDLFRDMADLGWTGLSVPASAGGSGMGFLEEAVLFEEFGYALYPGPFFSTVALARPLLDDEDELAGIAAGSTTATLAWAEPDRPVTLRDPSAVETVAEEGSKGTTITGVKSLVPDMHAASLLLVIARGRRGPGVWAVDPEGEGVVISPRSTMDATRRLATVELRHAPARGVCPSGELDPGPLRSRVYAALALEAVGIATKVLELSRDYATERTQFDKPIGAYQAVAHKLSDMYLETELARSLSYWAAWAVDADDEAVALAVPSAKGFAAEAAVRCCERAIQVHGGTGFTWEHVLHLYYKRSQWIASFDGFGAEQRAAVAQVLLQR